LFHLGQTSIHIGTSLLQNGETIYPDGGLRLLGFFCAGLCVLNFILAYFLLPESLSKMNEDHRKFSQSFQGFTSIWRVEIIGELFVINVIYIAAFMMMQINSAIMWKERYGLDEVHTGYIFGFIGLCSAVIQGGLIGKFQKWIGVKKMLVYGCPLVAVGLVLVPLPSQDWFYPVQALSILCLTVGNGFLMPSINSLVSINTSALDQGKTLGLLQSFSSLSRAIGPLISTAIYSIFYMLPYLVAAGLMLIAFWLAIRLSHQIGNEDKPAGSLTT
jgi:MFS family permease